MLALVPQVPLDHKVSKAYKDRAYKESKARKGNEALRANEAHRETVVRKEIVGYRVNRVLLAPMAVWLRTYLHASSGWEKPWQMIQTWKTPRISRHFSKSVTPLLH